MRVLRQGTMLSPVRHYVVCVILWINLYSIVSQAQVCSDTEDWCKTILVDYCQHSPDMKVLCPKSCGTCLPEECAECEHNCTLHDDGNTHTCTCYRGFRLNSDKRHCDDINECAEDEKVCENHKNGTVCSNFAGGYECTSGICKDFSQEGYAGYYKRPSECCKMTFGTCGQNTQNTGRIIGGKPANFGMWPWQAFIVLSGSSCGGTLINHRWILSAAHCFASVGDVKKAKVNIRFGVHRTDDLQASHVQIRHAVKLIRHPKYKFPKYDIALVKLNKPVTISMTVAPICLPNGHVPTPGTKCFATGYGVTVVGGAPSRELREVDLAIVEDEVCKKAYDKEMQIDTATMICAGHKQGGKDACQGDSGGPLVCQRCDSCDWYLTGITSFAAGCAEAGSYGVYTKVENFEKWIENNAEDIEIKKEECLSAKWTNWGGWGKCTKECGSGTHSRLRYCQNGQAGLPGCLGDGFESQPCNEMSCEKDEDKWSKWDACSLTCGGGQQTRRRICVTRGCIEVDQQKKCNTHDCPTWTNWGMWSECSASCGDGESTRDRICGTTGCEGSSSQKKPCNKGRCAAWGDWGGWSECDVSCGGSIQKSTRACVGGTAVIDCGGFATKLRKCNTDKCPVFGQWTNWSSCSLKCGGGEQKRTRSCQATSCVEDDFGTSREQTRACNEEECIGEWTLWSPWSSCSKTCDDGTRRRKRTCSGGTKCPGPDMHTAVCNLRECLGTWAEWSLWSECNKTCGPGARSRSRTCEKDKICLGSDNENEDCNEMPCAVWTEWSIWDECTVTCGGGTRKRNRTCRQGDSVVDTCPGEDLQNEDCGTDECEAKCSERCRQQVDLGHCVFHTEWMDNFCNMDCCKKVCQDKSTRCQDLGDAYCYNRNFAFSCLRMCGLCT